MSDLSPQAKALIDAGRADGPSAALKAQIKANVIAEVGVTAGAVAGGSALKLLLGGTLGLGLIAGAVISGQQAAVPTEVEIAPVVTRMKAVPAPVPLVVKPVAPRMKVAIQPAQKPEVPPVKAVPARRTQPVVAKLVPTPKPQVVRVSGLAEEAKLLKRMRVALRERAFERVLELAREHEGHFAQGVLVAERWASQALAECGLGHHAKGLALRAKLAERAPASVYLVRIDAVCQHSVR